MRARQTFYIEYIIIWLEKFINFPAQTVIAVPETILGQIFLMFFVCRIELGCIENSRGDFLSLVVARS